MATNRSRIFTGIGYEESCSIYHSLPCDENANLFICSPIHASDDEELKAHCHYIVVFDSPKTLKAAEDMMSSYGIVRVQPVMSLRSMIRYLIHADCPNKEQGWTPDDILVLSSLHPKVQMAFHDDSDTCSNIEKYIVENNIMWYHELVLSLSGDKELHDFVVKHSGHFARFLRSLEMSYRYQS